MTADHFTAVWQWRGATPEAMFKHLYDLHCQVSVLAMLIHHRDEYYDCATPTSTEEYANTQDLLRKVPA